MMEGRQTVFFISYITLHISPLFCRRIKNFFVVIAVDPSERSIYRVGRLSGNPVISASFFILWNNVPDKVNAYRYTYLHNYSV